MGYAVQQSTTSKALVFLMVDSSDHLSPKTGLTPTVVLSKNGAAFASPSGSVAEVGNGWYKVAGNATDSATLGPLVLHATSSGADPSDDVFDVVAYNPADGVRLGLTALPNVAAGANGGLPTGNGSGQVVASQVAGNVTGSVASVTGNVGGNVTGSVGSVAGAVGSVTAGVVVTTNNDKTGYSATVAGYATNQDPETRLLVTPANKLATDSSNRVTAASVAGNVGGNVVGSVGSVTGAVGSVTGGVTVGTNNDKTGYALTGGEHTGIATDTQTGLTAQGYTGARATKVDNLDAAVTTRLAASADPTSALAMVIANESTINTNVLSRLATSGYTAPDNAAVASIKAKTDQFGFTSSNVNAAIADKTGFKLASDGLDTVATTDITDDSNGRSTLPKMIRAIHAKSYNEVQVTADTETVANDSGSVVSTMALSDDGTTITKAKSA